MIDVLNVETGKVELLNPAFIARILTNPQGFIYVGDRRVTAVTEVMMVAPCGRVYTTESIQNLAAKIAA